MLGRREYEEISLPRYSRIEQKLETAILISHRERNISDKLDIIRRVETDNHVKQRNLS